MPPALPQFWSQPIRYMRWAAVERPALFFSIAIASLGPFLVFTVPPIREKLGDGRRPVIPLTYPGMYEIEEEEREGR